MRTHSQRNQARKPVSNEAAGFSPRPWISSRRVAGAAAAAAAAAAKVQTPVQPATPAAPTGCDPHYAGACVPVASDVDCAGGSGNGPAYVRGPVTVVGSDTYGLDSNRDGVGCEG